VEPLPIAFPVLLTLDQRTKRMLVLFAPESARHTLKACQFLTQYHGLSQLFRSFRFDVSIFWITSSPG